MLGNAVSSVVRRSSRFFHSLNRLSAIVLLMIAFSVAASAQIVTADFEDGGTDGFFPFGSPTLTNSTAQSNTGTHSLLVTNRTATYMGPGYNLSTNLVGGQTYLITVYARLSDSNPGSDTLQMTMQSTPSGGSASYSTVASGTVTNTGWTKLTGAFTPATGSPTLILYVEDPSSATDSYYIDTFSVTASAASDGCSNPPDNSGFSSNFEDGTAEGWVGRGGNETLTPTQADAHSGAWSLLVTNRQQTWNGPTHDITGKMCNGQQYAVVAWVKMAPGQAATTLNLSLQYTDVAGQQHYPSVVSSAQPVTDSAWVELKAKPYTFSGSYTNLQIYVQAPNSANASFYIDDVSVTYFPPPTIENIPSIAQTYSSYFPVGFAAVDSDILGVHGQLAALHYNSLTPGNDLKWDTTEPTEGSFNFAPADALLAWAQSHNVKMRGHNFVWYQQTPSWVFADANGVDMSTEPYSEANKALLLSRLKNHIDAVINHYGSSLYVWDVVNEAIDETKADGYRRDEWYNITQDPSLPFGTPPEYMDDAFIYTREALDAIGVTRQQTELCYNDYNTTIPAKQAFIYNWVKGAIARGVPIDCVGSQFHNNITFPTPAQAAQTINLFNTLTSTAGKPIINEVTEFDMSLYAYGNCSQNFFTDYDTLLADDQPNLAIEGYLYAGYFQVFRNLKSKIDSVTIWGLGDDDSWLNPNTNLGCYVTPPGGGTQQPISAADAPLPFDSYLQHKYAYTGIVNPSQLPGANLVANITSKSGAQNARVWVVTLDNPGPGTAYASEIDGFTLTQTGGAACTPVITPPSAYPVALGDLTSGESTSAPFTIDFTGCAATARFTATVPFDSSSGNNAHTLVSGNQFR